MDGFDLSLHGPGCPEIANAPAGPGRCAVWPDGLLVEVLQVWELALGVGRGTTSPRS